MPEQETPPHSPSMILDPDDIHINENDMVEVIDDESYNVISELDDGEDGAELDGEENSGIVSDSDNEQDEHEIIPLRDDAHMVLEHQGDVLCCQFHPKNNNMIVSGGVDEQAIIWDISNGTKLFTCKGHEESVEIAIFSHDGSYLATGDLGGVIKVWRIRDFELIATLELEDELSWMQWHNGINVLVASSQIGMIYMYKMPGAETKMVLASFGQNCLAGKILPDGKTLACGYQDGSLKLVDLRQGTVLKDVKLFEGAGGITCIDVHKNNGLIICGCVSGSVVLVNSNSGKVVSILQGCLNPEGGSYIEAVSFCKDLAYPFAASGSLDGVLSIWDTSKQTLRHSSKFRPCVNHLAWHPSIPLLFTCHVGGVVHAFDPKAGVVLKGFLGHKKSCLNMAISSDATLLMTASEDKTVRIYTVGDVFTD